MRPDFADGSSPFSVQLHFSDSVASPLANVGAAIQVQNGTVSNVALVAGSDRKYEMTITPSSAAAIRLSVRSAQRCSDSHAICSTSGQWLDKESKRWISTANDARLRNLSLKYWAGGYIGGTPKFSSDTSKYRAELLNRTSRLVLVAAPFTPGSTVSFSGSGVGSTTDRFDGGAEAEISVPVGTSTVRATVTAADGVTTKTYTYTFERAASPVQHPYIKTLTVEPVSGSLESLRWPELGGGAVFARVSAGTAQVTVTAEARDPWATVSLQSLAPGAASASSLTLTLNQGANVLLLTVDGFIYRKFYFLHIDKADAAKATVADPLTAKFQNQPVAHDGSSVFSLQLEFTELLARGSGRRIWRALSVTSGRLKSVRRVEKRRDLYEIRVMPDGSDAVMVSLFSRGNCGEDAAICTADNQTLSRGSATRIAGPAGISVDDAQAQEAADATVDFVVTLSQPASEKVTVDYATSDGTATAGSDYAADSGELIFEIEEVSKTVQISVLEDSIDEGEETFTLTLSNPRGGNAYLVRATATGTIENDGPMPRAWLARFARTVASQAVDAIGGRLEGDGSTRVTVGGHALDLHDRRTVEPGAWIEPDALPGGLAGADESGWTQAMTARELLLGSSFRLAPAGAAGSAAWTAWGRVATGGFDADDDDGVRGDGRVTSGFLGADYSPGPWLAGVALGTSEGEGGFAAIEGTDGGDVESSLTAIYPYARVDLNDDVQAWGLAGLGTGELSLTLRGDANGASGQTYTTDLAMRMGAMGVRGPLLPSGGPGVLALALRSDAFWVSMASDAVRSPAGNLEASKVDASRLRLILEGSQRFEAGGGALTPTLELGLRYDGGDAETGAGLEAGAALAYAGGGVSVEGSVRTLVAHRESDYREWGAAGAVRIDPGALGQGLSLTVASAWGAEASGAGRLWSLAEAGGLATDGAFEAGRRMDAELGYGLDLAPAPGGLTPYVALSLADGGARAWRTGARWRISPHAGLGLEATERESAHGSPAEHGIAMRLGMHW